MKKMMLGLLFTAIGSFNAYATLPTYDKAEILARANLYNGHNLPPLTFFSNTYPVINERGDVVFKLAGVEGTPNHAIWVKKAEEDNGKIVYVAPEDRFMSEPSVNAIGNIAFSLYDIDLSDGIFTFDIDSQKLNHAVTPGVVKDILYYNYPQVLSNGKVFFRGSSNNNERAFYSFDKDLSVLLTEGTSILEKKTSYLFRMTANDSEMISFKRRIGESGQWDERNPDEIVLLKKGNNGKYTSTIIARDVDADPTSIFLSFANATSLSQNGLVAFIATLKTGPKALILYKDGLLKNIVTEKTEDLSELEMFDPKVNDLGQIVFRGKDFSGKRSLYIANEDGVKKIISEGDDIMTDVGMAKILSNPIYPGFGGNVDMNNRGEIVFYCLLMNTKGDRELGSAVYLFKPLNN